MRRIIVLIMTVMLTGRAMTLAFLHRVGGDGPGDPPIAWLMPLLGDAAVGIAGLAIAFLIWRRHGLLVWTACVVWNVVAIWDALSAYIIHMTVPWPEFFMVQLFGGSMFFAASAMHATILILVCREPLRTELLSEGMSLSEQPSENNG